MFINSKEFFPVDTREKITMADSFVVRANKLGSGNGESKLYIGNDGEALRSFYGNRGFKNKCFMLREDMVGFLNDLKAEYTSPQLPYKKKEDLPELFFSRQKKVLELPQFVWFSIEEQTQIEGPRVYINSGDSNYQLIRELSLPNLSYISLMKLSSVDGEVVYYVRLFTDFMDSFGAMTHPVEIQKEVELVKEDTSLTQEEKLQTVKARIGQGKYRKQLLEQCPFCPVTLVSDDRLLIASHIKPWASSEQHEKTDPKNGFMFTPTIDYLFDSGFITFEDNKKMIVSPWLSKPTIHRLNIKPMRVIDQLPVSGREKYLSYHRAKVFKA
jgi:putative restriction endonuclease